MDHVGQQEIFELVSRDESVKAELEKASLAAFEALLIKKGLNDEAQKALTEATAKVAAAHGFKLGGMGSCFLFGGINLCSITG